MSNEYIHQSTYFCNKIRNDEIFHFHRSTILPIGDARLLKIFDFSIYIPFDSASHIDFDGINFIVISHFSKIIDFLKQVIPLHLYLL